MPPHPDRVRQNYDNDPVATETHQHDALEAAIVAVSGVELNCPHCGERSSIAGSEVRRLVAEAARDHR